jgi:transposase-like protein
MSSYFVFTIAAINFLIAMSKTRMRERGLDVDHSTVFRWIQRYAPEINKRTGQHPKMSGTSYRVDETYILRREDM